MSLPLSCPNFPLPPFFCVVTGGYLAFLAVDWSRTVSASRPLLSRFPVTVSHSVRCQLLSVLIPLLSGPSLPFPLSPLPRVFCPPCLIWLSVFCVGCFALVFVCLSGVALSAWFCFLFALPFVSVVSFSHGLGAWSFWP